MMDLQMSLYGRLAACFDRWHACTVSPCVIQTVTSGYRLQFVVCPPRFCGVFTSTVPLAAAPVLREETGNKSVSSVLKPRTAGTAGISWVLKGVRTFFSPSEIYVSSASISNFAPPKCSQTSGCYGPCVPAIGSPPSTKRMHNFMCPCAPVTEYF